MEWKYQFVSLFKMIVAVAAFAIMITLFGFYFVNEKKQSEQFACGVVDERPVCGNYIRRLKAGVSSNRAGEGLFKTNCSACHDIHDIVVGPALKDVEKRRPKKWLYKFINNSSAVIKAGDPYALELYNKFYRIEKPKYNFTKAEIDSILDYIKSESVY